MVLFLLQGEMPWHEQAALKLKGRQRINFVIKMKLSLPIEEYADKVPSKTRSIFLNHCFISWVLRLIFLILIGSFLNSYYHVRKLGYDDSPDYVLIKQWILQDMQALITSKHVRAEGLGTGVKNTTLLGNGLSPFMEKTP